MRPMMAGRSRCTLPPDECFPTQVFEFPATRHRPALLEADDVNVPLPFHRAAAANSESFDALQALVQLCPSSLRTKDTQRRVLPLHFVDEID